MSNRVALLPTRTCRAAESRAGSVHLSSVRRALQRGRISGAQPMPEGQAAKPKPEAPAEGQAERPAQPEEQPADQAAGQGGEHEQQTGERARNQQEEPATTGAIAAKGKISDEQRTEIRNTIVETHVEPVDHVDFDISIGVAVPSTVVLYRCLRA